MTHVIVGDVENTVHATDQQALLAPRVLQAIVAAVMDAMRAELEHGRRVRAETATDRNHHVED